MEPGDFVAHAAGLIVEPVGCEAREIFYVLSKVCIRHYSYCSECRIMAIFLTFSHFLSLTRWLASDGNINKRTRPIPKMHSFPLVAVHHNTHARASGGPHTFLEVCCSGSVARKLVLIPKIPYTWNMKVMIWPPRSPDERCP